MAERVCKTPGAMFSIGYQDGNIRCVVRPPSEQKNKILNTLSTRPALRERWDNLVHDAMEEATAQILQDIKE